MSLSIVMMSCHESVSITSCVCVCVCGCEIYPCVWVCLCVGVCGGWVGMWVGAARWVVSLYDLGYATVKFNQLTTLEPVGNSRQLE